MEVDEDQPTEMGATTTAAVAAAGSMLRANGAESPPPPRKRLKLTLADDAIALRKRILEHKLIRLRNMRERLTEQLSELYFLQAGGNMMDYAAWRKRPPTPQLLAFLDARRPPAHVSGSAPAPATPALHPTSSVSPPTASAPPAAVVSAPVVVPAQTPRLPNGTGEDKRHAAVVRTQSGGSEIHQSHKQQDSTLLELDVAASAGAPTASLTPNNAQEEIVEKAKQEAYVARRVAELARAGLWTERRLPRVLEPPRPKTHWDYLLEEMAWLAQDFANERKWKKHAAKKCARMVQKHFQDKAMAAQRAEKAHELQLRRIAAFAAKEIRNFWTNIEKVVEWKRSVRLERARKAALDEQLSYIVDRTERYSQQLAAGMSTSAASSIGAPPSDDEFEPGSGSGSSDDEETIAAAERDNTDTRDEVDALRRESRLELRDVLRTLPPGYRPGAPPSPPASGASSVSASASASASASRASTPAPSDYSAAGDNSTDDETTIAEEERNETVDTTAELDELRRESEMSIEDLLRSYRADGEVAPAIPATPATDTQSDTDDEADSDSGTSGEDEGDAASEHSSAPSETLEALVAEPATEIADKGTNDGAEEERVQAAAALAATLQPTGTTLSETAVGTPVPRLLRGGALREYQHVGLHWLATMHARCLNGILADEMGLGKTIQTIALLAHLALERGDWGPHLVVAPTSLVLNWELEFKKWCPAFKLLTYYGTIKERKLKRVGWTKANCFHVCITSYKLVVQDHQSFRRKRWKYLILDEAQNIKNFKSQRWQMLLNFQTERRLLLTGTPLQNSLLELWSLMHFLMPDVFESHSEFREWFAPVAGIAEGSHKYNEDIVRRLHKVLRPFLLRRLKADVERQMPRKYEHVLLCRLSKRQRYLYDDFMSRAKTKESLASGNLLSVINVLMQLRKVCNHPDLFEPRAVHSPLQLSAIELRVPAFLLLSDERSVLAATVGGDLATLEATGAEAFVSHRARHLAPPRRLIEELPADEAAHTPRPSPPDRRKLRLHLRMMPRTPAVRLTALRMAPAPLHLPVPPPDPSPPPPQTKPQPVAARVYNTYNEACAARLEARRRASLRRLGVVNERRCWRLPLYGADLRGAAAAPPPLPIEAAVEAPSLDQLVTRLVPTLERFSVCWAAARAPAPRLVVGTGAAVWRRHVARLEERAADAAQPFLRILHLPALLQSVAFPHPRLLQYDCGKLQTLDALLRRLKAGGHRVLIFTQMTRVLDVLEAFLSMHGHTYLRLDGATRVDRRQPLVDRFNSDPRLFAFILSTRSGGVGLNLAGADCVIFYDSDWNPTMDAQAQDRCHRIGQTRDVHVYRLVTAATVEENILRKAEQKRALGHLAIEDGHFTTSYLRAANIHELFGEAAASAANVSGAPADLESALAAAEDEADAAAASAARAEAQRDLAEFDETLPLAADDGEDGATAATAPDDDQPRELRTLLQQLRPVEKYAMRILENSESAAEAERVAREHVERQRDEWQSARRALQREPSPPPPPPPDSPTLDLTYTRADARNQVWLTAAGRDKMPMWCPPTPPQGDGDVYMESWTRALYRPGAAPGDLLPPTARPPPRTPRSPRPRRHFQRVPLAPASLFDRAAPRVRSRLRHHPHAAATHAPHTPHPHPHAALDWTPAEDAALRRGLRLQRLSAEPPAAHTPNWEWVADLVADVARVYRTARACRDRYEAVCADDHRAHRKQKKGKPRHDETAPRPPLARIESMREAAERRRRAPKRRYEDPSPHNAKHAALLADLGVDYDKPPSPMEVATRRAERIAKEKLKAGGGSAAGSQPTSAATPTPPPAAPPTSSSAPTVAAAAASATLHHATQRIVVAAHPVATLIKGSSVSGVTGAGTSGATQLYRQQALARHQLKILQQAAPGATAGSEALRTLQLHQLAVGRARSQQPGGAGASGVSAAGAGGPSSRPPHVVVAHLTHPQHLRQSSPASAPAVAAATQPAPAPAAHNQSDLTDRQ